MNCYVSFLWLSVMFWYLPMLLWTLVIYSFLLLNSILLYEYITVHLSVQTLVNAWVIPNFCDMNRAGMIIHIRVPCGHIFIFLGVVRSYSKYIWSFVWNCQTIFQSGSTILRTYQQCGRTPVAPHPCQYVAFSASSFFFLVKFILVILVDLWGYFKFAFPWKVSNNWSGRWGLQVMIILGWRKGSCHVL